MNNAACDMVGGEKPTEQPAADTLKCDVSDIPDFDRLVGKGNVIPHDGLLPLRFSQRFLQTLDLEGARKKLQVLGEYRKEIYENDVKFRVIDIDLDDTDPRREVPRK
jgi:hypothetical protein